MAADPVLEGLDADQVEARVLVVDANDVVAAAALDDRVAADRADVDHVVVAVRGGWIVAAAQDQIAAERGRVDEERVVAGAEVDLDVLEAVVLDSQGHAQAGEERCREDSVVASAAVARVVGLERVAACLGVEDEVGVRDPVQRAEQRVVGLGVAPDADDVGA